MFCILFGYALLLICKSHHCKYSTIAEGKTQLTTGMIFEFWSIWFLKKKKKKRKEFWSIFTLFNFCNLIVLSAFCIGIGIGIGLECVKYRVFKKMCVNSFSDLQILHDDVVDPKLM